MDTQADLGIRGSSSRHALPLELVGSVLEFAARATLDKEPHVAAALQLVSRTTRGWLLPIFYEVLVVRWPKRGSGNTPSLEFLLQVATELPTSMIRSHIRHIAIIAPHELPETGSKIPMKPGEWNIDSI